MPHYENLTLDHILEYGLSFKSVVDALPPPKETRKMPRQYLCNLIFHQVGQAFKDWVLKNCEERNENFTEKHGLEIKLQKRIAEAAAASTAVSRKSDSTPFLIFIFSSL